MFAKMQQSTDNSTTFRTEASYLEIYNEKVKDLLGPDANGAHGLKVRAKSIGGKPQKLLNVHIHNTNHYDKKKLEFNFFTLNVIFIWDHSNTT